MRYVPDLIPANSKVLPEYFKGDSYDFKETDIKFKNFTFVVAICLFITAFFFTKHIYITLLFILQSVFLLTSFQSWIERKFRFRLTRKIISVFSLTMLLGTIVIIYFVKSKDFIIEAQVAKELKIQQEKDRQEKIEADKKDLQRKDSLNYIQEAASLTKSNKPEQAIAKLELAVKFSSTEQDRNELWKDRENIITPQALKLVKEGKYKQALLKLNELLSLDPKNSNLLYNRAICYSRVGNIQDAVDDCKIAIMIGNLDADKLFNQINPIRKKVIDYLTLCCDGSTSSTNGRGACSHHGGVCGSKAIYELDRKYGAKNKQENDSLNKVNADILQSL